MDPIAINIKSLSCVQRVLLGILLLPGTLDTSILIRAHHFVNMFTCLNLDHLVLCVKCC